ncbi:DUF3098 domain-containing protein [Prevotella cerevisiae]|jgi:membrane-bound ClpP family serine protease|uniref:DUF3098 domain-containing protein n=1 Tax=Segatella cerevisiae TaxID=2053716 RepID=A0ABT1BWR3_9BACT|nr:DUF3098 domain-containing protein [Segatella cerevisiae]MCH3994463.1 DUF3098 domain-containing protein [Prevotella sp.]MCO6024838.1 DUF3098 domain-containing protein [Segatella cerevisiae]
MDKKNYAFDKVNFILLAVGMLIVIIGFILMSGAGSNETHFEPSIFDARRIKVAPVVCLVGFLSMIYAVARRPRDTKNSDGESELRENEQVESSSQDKH